MNEFYKDINILIIGDSCTDVFTYGHVLRLAPEGPAPVFNPTKNKSNGGMASNVHANIKAIGAKSTLVTQNEKITKTRFIDERTNTLLMRLDSNDQASKIPYDILNSINNNTFNNIKYEAIIVSDYCKGFLSEDDIKNIASKNKNIFLDTKKILGDWCKNVDYIKINHTEYDRTKHTIAHLNLYDKMIITRSDEGCEHKSVLYPVQKVIIKDVSGAGDTFLAGLVTEYCYSNDIIKAIHFAQECATKVVQKKGVCTV